MLRDAPHIIPATASCTPTLVYEQAGSSSCVLGKTYGCDSTDAAGVWVKAPCRGVFSVAPTTGHGGNGLIACPPLTAMSQPAWVNQRCEPPVRAPAVRPPTEPCCEWEMRNACIAYVPYVQHLPGGKHRHLRHTLLADASAPALRPLAFPGHFEEGTSKLRPERAMPGPLLTTAFAASLWRVWHDDDDALVVDMSFDNIWHVLFHAIPTRQSVLRRGVPPARTALLPRYTNQWPNSPSLTQWSGWEVLVRSLHGSDPTVVDGNAAWARAAATTQTIVSSGVWHCYSRLRGGHRSWWPGGAFNNDTVFHALAEWRRSVLSTLGRRIPIVGALEMNSSAPVDHTIVFELRTMSRVILNTEELQSAILADARLGVAAPSSSTRATIEFASLGALPLTEQLRRVSTAVGLAGVHGAGLSWAAFLPTDGERRCALLEIMPHRMSRQATHAGFDYMRIAGMNHVKHWHLTKQPDAPACRDRDFRTCGNLSVVVPKVVAALQQMLTYTACPPRTDCKKRPALGSVHLRSSALLGG